MRTMAARRGRSSGDQGQLTAGECRQSENLRCRIAEWRLGAKRGGEGPILTRSGCWEGPLLADQRPAASRYELRRLLG